MGQNRRYGSDVTDASLNEFVIRPAPISLSPEELGDVIPPEAPNPIEVQAWVRFPQASMRVHGTAVAWTDKAVWVEFTMRDGATKRAWVWASAVDRL